MWSIHHDLLQLYYLSKSEEFFQEALASFIPLIEMFFSFLLLLGDFHIPQISFEVGKWLDVLSLTYHNLGREGG